MDPVELKEPELTNAPPERLSHIEKNLHEFKVQVISEEKELSTKQVHLYPYSPINWKSSSATFTR